MRPKHCNTSKHTLLYAFYLFSASLTNSTGCIPRNCAVTAAIGQLGSKKQPITVADSASGPLLQGQAHAIQPRLWLQLQ
jgi:hypothetical protein